MMNPKSKVQVLSSNSTYNGKIVSRKAPRSAHFEPATQFGSLTRSKLMARIRGKGNKTTENRMMALFKINRISGWRRQLQMPGRPDFIFPEVRVAIFVDGCFWHGCPRHFKTPSTNREFWQLKISRNQARDRKVGSLLKTRGWKVIRVWEHSLRGMEVNRLMKRLSRVLRPV
jgi:DNA mismatch endonuclease (patch repair protein)